MRIFSISSGVLMVTVMRIFSSGVQARMNNKEYAILADLTDRSTPARPSAAGFTASTVMV